MSDMFAAFTFSIIGNSKKRKEKSHENVKQRETGKENCRFY